jgi:hypothetical protein
MTKDKEISQDLITYVTLLSAMQVVQNCALELEGTIYDQGKVKVKTREAVNAMTQVNDKRKRQMWENDSLMAGTFMHTIHVIGEQLAKGDGTALANIAALTRQGIDLSKYKYFISYGVEYYVDVSVRGHLLNKSFPDKKDNKWVKKISLIGYKSYFYTFIF